ncbi:MAG: HD domain-containing protein [Candidatus Cloacimonetes bacterium]|nr:HD domain-containing protein [Candidatus Cloacimonadota bacterium]
MDIEKTEKIFREDLGNYLDKEIETYFLVTEKDLREGKTGSYLRVRISDRTGNIMGNVWNNASSIAEKFEVGDIVKLKAMVIKYKEQLQLTVQKIRKVQEFEIDLSDYISATEKDVNKLSERLFGIIDSVSDPYLSSLLKLIFDDKEFYADFGRAPAAKSWHHNYLNGLLEHTVAVANICDFASHSYPLDRDLLMSGALLHDIGKVDEYKAAPAIDFTDAGRLLGHIVIADQKICEKSRQIDHFPADLLMKLRHLILSHHGEYDKGSVRLPQMLEAIMLHHADNLDAQVTGVSQVIKGQNRGSWSEYDRLNNRYYYTGLPEESEE